MPADALRLFVFARHAESAANAADVLSTNPSQPVDGAGTALGERDGVAVRGCAGADARRSCHA